MTTDERNTALRVATVALCMIQSPHVQSGRFRHFADAEALRAAGVPVPAGWVARCDEYVSPRGVGFVLVMQVDDLQAAVNVGPEVELSHDWREVNDAE